MIIWSGLGFLGLLIPFVVCFLFNLVIDLALGRGYVAVHNWPLGVGLLISAALVYGTGERLNGPGKTLIDPANGQTVNLPRRNTLFFLPLKWIAVALAVIGLYFVVAPKHVAVSDRSSSTMLQTSSVRPTYS